MNPQQALQIALQHHQNGRLAEAEALYRKVLDAEPKKADALHLLGVIAQQQRRHEEAVKLIGQAIAISPQSAVYHCNLGIALDCLGRKEEAFAACQRALALKPDYLKALNTLALVSLGMGRLDEAAAASQRAIQLQPDSAEAHRTLGNALTGLGRLEEAVAACRRAAELQPGSADAHNSLGVALAKMRRYDDAIAAYRRAAEIKPVFPEPQNNLGIALIGIGEIEQAVQACRRAIALAPHDAEFHGNLAFFLNYQPCQDARAILGEHRRWAAQHAEPLQQFIQPHRNGRNPDRRLRIGYVSPDFWTHPVAFFLEGLLANHDRAEVDVHCYSDVTEPDAVTARLEGHAGHWRRITGMDDSQVADLVREDGIDILVDLAGHTAHNRLLVFARKPAPVQVSWLGYPNTTGMETMDWRLSDALADPPGTTEELHTERLVRLPRCAWCYRPPEDAPAVGAPPVIEAGHITFGCFNAMPKINGPLLELWARVLLAVPRSRLLLKNGALREPSVLERVRAALKREGIAPERLEFMGHVSGMANHLTLYRRVDIALDSFPYHGTTTTCEALWMGVPVITLAEKTHVSRVGVSLLGNAGFPELVAASQEDYVRIATELATDLPRLTRLRSTLRERMAQSPLMDAPRFARAVESAFRKMWRRWCSDSASFPNP